MISPWSKPQRLPCLSLHLYYVLKDLLPISQCRKTWIIYVDRYYLELIKHLCINVFNILLAMSMLCSIDSGQEERHNKELQ